MVNKHIQVYGRVQGVGFRYFTATTAKALGIVGWVRNLGDGSVEIMARGSEDEMNAFLASMDEGPVFAYVENLVVVDCAWSDSEKGFRIR